MVPFVSRKRCGTPGLGPGRAFPSGATAATSRCRTWSRKCDELSTGLDLDEAVPGQGLDCLRVEVLQWTSGLGDQAQRLRSTLAERALERGLLALRFVATAPRGALAC